jgi:cytochrome d ubiquinol oxidase subunit I
MLIAAWTGLVQLVRGKLAESRLLLRALPWMIPSGFVAVLAGWCTTEIGRQPYVVYGLMRTAEAVSPVPGAAVATTLALFLTVYGGVFGAGIYYLVRLVRTGPLDVEVKPAATAARPLGAADDPLEEPAS